MIKELTSFEKFVLWFFMVIVVLCSIAILFSSCGICSGDLLLENKFSGDGKVDSETLSAYQYGRIMVDQADNYQYQDKRTEDTKGNYDYQIKANIVNASGKRSDRIEYRNKEAGTASQEVRMTNIKNFDGEMIGYIHTDEDGIVSYDSVFDIEGNGKFYARAVDARSGKPLTISLQTAIGNISQWQHYNLSMPKDIDNPENWLCFCELYNENISPITGVKLYPIYANGVLMNLTEDNIQLLRKFNVTI